MRPCPQAPLVAHRPSWAGWLRLAGFFSLRLDFTLIPRSGLDFDWIWFDFVWLLAFGLDLGLDFAISVAFTMIFTYSSLSYALIAS